ncbi:MAG: asparagine synthase (glutamine-hydrolyzing) [Ignavibacteriales bacterium]|nr:asparagine synthase (glutamine-hydrolyzing) [Ignavibacteriales bacterium]
MCGFVAIICKNSRDYFNFLQLKVMTDTLIHRGPDDEGYLIINKNLIYDIKNQINLNNSDNSNQILINDPRIKEISGELLFGFRRLSILDTSSKGHQPMNYLKRYWIVFNGEIYNYLELQAELKNYKYQFNTNSDTEVILAAYDHWGVKCFEKFNGMWALIIYDSIKRNVVISRDRFGIKPIYYYDDGKTLIFASEIKAIHKSKRDTKLISIDKCKNFLSIGENSSLTTTLFNNIHRFPCATFSCIKLNLSVNTELVFKKYWTLNINESIEKFDKRKLDDYADKYIIILADAVKLRLRADVKVGAALSGGLDSSSIVYLITHNLGISAKNFQTFSNVYPLPGFDDIDESKYIKTLVNYFDINSAVITPNPEGLFDEYIKMIYHSDLPPNGSNMSGWHTYKLTKNNGVIVTLDGQGADEILAGYSSYIFNYLNELSFLRFFTEIKKFRNFRPKIDMNRMILAKLFFRLQHDVVKIIANHFGINQKMGAKLNDALEIDLRDNLANLLRYGDYLSMAHSVESRLPFLDYRLVEFLFAISSTYKMHDGWTKYISRDTLK